MYRGQRRRRRRPRTRRPAATHPVPRCCQPVRRGNGAAIEYLIDQQIDQRRGMFRRHVDSADLSLRFGPNMPHLPGRSALLHNGQDVAGCLVTQLESTIVAVSAGGVRAVRTIGATASELPNTAAASLSQVARCSARDRGMFGVAGLQRRLLCQVQRFDRCRWASMIILELEGQLAAAGLDVGTAGRPALIQSRIDTDDLPDRPLRRIGAGPLGEPHPQRVTEMLFQRSVVGLRRRHVGLEQHPPIDG
jgi:hypothetical protein